MTTAAGTVGRALEDVRGALSEAKLPDAAREADELYAAIVCGATSAAFLDKDKPIADAVRARLTEAALRRAAGWPQAYAAGRANFRGHWLAVDHRVLIPRPETEGLVELVMQWIKDGVGLWVVGSGEGRSPKPGTHNPTPLVADVGTGSGAIAIALALEAPVSGVIATDVSADALNIALENATMLGAKERISFRRGNLLDPLLDDRVDVLVSNPPYVATAEWDALDASVKDYEPRLALDGGADGLDPYRVIAGRGLESLSPGGLLALEIDARRAGETAGIVRAAGFEQVTVGDDLFGRPRYLLARKPA